MSGVRALKRRRARGAVVAVVLGCAVATIFDSRIGNAEEAPTPLDGAALFKANCAVCHREAGTGTPGLAPPLTKNPAVFAATDAGRRQLAETLLFGMFGEIVVDERTYNFKMPEFSKLDDATLAAVLNHVVFDLAGAQNAARFTAAEIAPRRSQLVDGAVIHARRALALAPPSP